MAAADFVLDLIDRLGTTIDLNDPLQRSLVGVEIHNAYLSRHEEARDGPLGRSL